jgi:hypothetical protein
LDQLTPTTTWAWTAAVLARRPAVKSACLRFMACLRMLSCVVSPFVAERGAKINSFVGRTN